MFYAEDQINDELNCTKCNQKLDEPRNLPCGETICAYCYISIEVNNNKFKCFICKKDHLMPEEGLPISIRLLRILALKSEEVYRGKEVKQLKENLEIIQEDINKFSFGIYNGIDKIKGLCLDLRNKVQLKTEEAIEQLNEHNKQMITEIEEFERECIKSYQANEKANNEFKKTKQELEEFNLKWNQYLKQTVISDEDVSGAIAKSNELSIKSRLIKQSNSIFNIKELDNYRKILNIKVLKSNTDYYIGITDVPKVYLSANKLHGDPFDLLIISQALTENLTILSSDSLFPEYDGLNVFLK
jgi:PIN domain nuclease of toxin-antitoxin system